MNSPDIALIKTYLLTLQDNICAALAQADGHAEFTEECWVREEGGGGRSRVLVNGAVFEQAGVNFSHVSGAMLPASATAHRPELAGRSFQALGRIAGYSSAKSLSAYQPRQCAVLYC